MVEFDCRELRDPFIETFWGSGTDPSPNAAMGENFFLDALRLKESELRSCCPDPDPDLDSMTLGRSSAGASYLWETDALGRGIEVGEGTNGTPLREILSEFRFVEVAPGPASQKSSGIVLVGSCSLELKSSKDGMWNCWSGFCSGGAGIGSGFPSRKSATGKGLSVFGAFEAADDVCLL